MPRRQILLVAPPGRLQEALQALLATLTDATVVVVGDPVAAGDVALRAPQLVVIAGSRSAEAVRQLRSVYAAALFLAVVPHPHAAAAARAAGAVEVLVEGAPAGRLLEIARHLLANPHPS